MSFEAFGYVITLTLPANEKWLLVCLSNHADKWGDSIFPSLDTLEEETGMSRSTLKRAFKELLKRGIIERIAGSTPVSPPFYRILGVPEPKEPIKEPTCPHVLRRAVIHTFQQRCEYCGRQGTRDLGPDDKPWNIDRVVPGKRGGIYAPDNVTLSCRACNGKKKANSAPEGTRTLAEVLRAGGSKLDGPSLQVGGSTLDAPTVPTDPSEELGRTLGPSNLDPEPVLDPLLESVPERKAGAATPRLTLAPEKEPELPTANIAVITKLAHEAIDQLGPDHEDLSETLKSLCARHRVAYRSDVIRAAIESALWQRRRRRQA